MLAPSPALPAARSETAIPTAAPVSREAAEKVLQYLVFHRSLLGEPDGAGEPTALLERYLGLVEGLKEGVHVVIADPFQKATALLFELVLDEHFDPWEIDLARFTQAYLERVREDGAVNFQIAGRLLYMAWSILLMQSEEVLRHQQTGPTATLDPVDDAAQPLDDDGYLPLLDTPEAVDVTSTVLGTSEPPALLEMVRHSESRPVSLLELVKAFGEAEADARQALKLQELRERLREEQRAPPEVLVHGDVPERDLADTWEAVARHPVGAPFRLLEMWNPLSGRDRLVAIFLAVLFLARERSVDLQQETLGATPVMIVRTVESRRPVAPEP